MTSTKPTRVIILGGGFAGISMARELGRKSKHDSSIEIHLISTENYFVFQPLLPEVVACGLEPSHIINPIRMLCPHVHIHCASVLGIDFQHQTVSLEGQDARRIFSLPFDHLMIGLGLAMDLSCMPGMSEHSLPIKTLGDAFHLRNHVLSKLEQADLEEDEQARRSALTFVAVGGGFSGVETIAEINDMIKSVLRYYPRARACGARVVLIHSRDRILNELGDKLAHFAERKMRGRGVEIMLEVRVKEATPAGVVLNNGEMIQADTVICSIGNAPHPLIAQSTLPQERGRILVDEYLRVKDHANIWALGDNALVPDVSSGGYCPPTAQYAMRQGKVCARNILATIRNQPIKQFSFGGMGQLAVVGHRCGVAQVMGLKLSGLLAWFLWRSVYLMKLPGLRCKIRVGIDWALDLFFPRDIAMIKVDRTTQLQRAHFREGELIIKQGEIGDKFYIIESGKVEVLREESNGSRQLLATLGAGDSFGEIALLKKTRRTATVRSLEPVDVVMFARKDFQQLAGSFRAFRDRVLVDLDDRENSSVASVSSNESV